MRDIITRNSSVITDDFHAFVTILAVVTIIVHMILGVLLCDIAHKVVIGCLWIVLGMTFPPAGAVFLMIEHDKEEY